MPRAGARLEAWCDAIAEPIPLVGNALALLTSSRAGEWARLRGASRQSGAAVRQPTERDGREFLPDASNEFACRDTARVAAPAPHNRKY